MNDMTNSPANNCSSPAKFQFRMSAILLLLLSWDTLFFTAIGYWLMILNKIAAHLVYSLVYFLVLIADLW